MAKVLVAGFSEVDKMRSRSNFLLVIVVIIAAASQVEAVLMDSINASLEPVDSPWGSIKEVGWLYTPDDAYYLSGIESKFGPSSTSIGPPFPGTGATLEVYDGLPGAGGSLLRSAAFSIFQWGVFVGGSFAPLEVVSGEDYFIGFVLTGPVILKNSTLDIDSVVALPCYGDEVADGTYSDVLDNPTEIHPVLLFEGEPIPEPGTILLLGFGGMVFLERRKQKKKAV